MPRSTEQIYQVSYVGKIEIRIPKVSFTTPYLTKQETIEFVAVIGVERLIEILKNDTPSSPQETTDFIQEVDEYVLRMFPFSKDNKGDDKRLWRITILSLRYQPRKIILKFAWIFYAR